MIWIFLIGTAGYMLLEWPDKKSDQRRFVGATLLNVVLIYVGVTIVLPLLAGLIMMARFSF